MTRTWNGGAAPSSCPSAPQLLCAQPQAGSRALARQAEQSYADKLKVGHPRVSTSYVRGRRPDFTSHRVRRMEMVHLHVKVRASHAPRRSVAFSKPLFDGSGANCR
ncbi:hypothetical protein GY45DRAFT_1327024 [Cubamyces sp. BRFM 1775]|nr:hypothetical protein GY45DRAFT_1327024 [Cubamyces sp. BRFM 1775]